MVIVVVFCGAEGGRCETISATEQDNICCLEDGDKYYRNTKMAYADVGVRACAYGGVGEVGSVEDFGTNTGALTAWESDGFDGVVG